VLAARNGPKAKIAKNNPISSVTQADLRPVMKLMNPDIDVSLLEIVDEKDYSKNSLIIKTLYSLR